MGASAQPEPDIVAQMRASLQQAREAGASKAQLDFLLREWTRHVQNFNEAEAARTPQTVGEAMAAPLSSAFDAGTFGLAGIVTDALSPGDFRTNRDMRQRAYNNMSTSDRVLSSIAGGLANPVNRLTMGIPATSGVVGTAARGALEGAAQGALTGFGENVGTTEGVQRAVVHGAVGGAVGGAVLTPLAKALAGRGGGVGEDAARRAMDARVADAGPVAPAPMPVQTGRLARPVPQQTPLAPVPPRFPTPMAIDEAGPTMLANARGATSTVQGREAFRAPFEARAQAMPEAVTGDAPDAVALGNDLARARAAAADPAYRDAIEATKGVPVETPALADLLRTPMGQKAWEQVAARRPNRVVGTGDVSRALPTRATPDGGTEVLPDAEAVHEIKRQLSEWASLDPNAVPPDGVDAIGAQDALGLFTRLRDEMPAPFKAADELYATMSRPMDALDMGRQPWRANPNPAAYKSEKLATTNALERFRGMDPPEQAMVSTGKRYDLASRIREGKLTLADALARMDNPQSTLAQEMAVAGGGLPERVRAWAPPLARQQQVLPSGQLALEPTINTPLASVMEAAAPTPEWAIVKAGRNLLGKASAQNMAKRGAEDAAFAGLMTGRPETLADVLANLATKDQRVQRAASRTAGSAGRVAGGIP